MVAPAFDTLTNVAELNKASNELFLLEFSKSRPAFELAEPPKTALPHVWRWTDYYPLLLKAAELMDVEQAFRRSFMFSNPGLYPKPFMTPTLDGSCSLYNPGESAPVHRHTPSASRFGLEGTGGFTTVDGEKCVIARGDLIMTPNGTWHDLGNDGEEQIIFLDIVNDPLVLALGGTFYDLDYWEVDPLSNAEKPVKKSVQTVREPADHSHNLYSSGGLLSRFTSHGRDRDERSSPMFVYRYEQTRETLERLRSYDGSPYDGVILEYVNPVTGAPAMPAMSFYMQLLRPGEHTSAHRHTASTVYCVVEGKGVTEVDQSRLEWSRNDVFAVPGWTWHEHINASDRDDAVLYSVSDAAALHKLGLYREQERSSAGDIRAVEA